MTPDLGRFAGMRPKGSIPLPRSRLTGEGKVPSGDARRKFPGEYSPVFKSALRNRAMIFLRTAFAALLLALAVSAAQAQSAPQLGRDYVRLDPPHAVSSGDQIE